MFGVLRKKRASQQQGQVGLQEDQPGSEQSSAAGNGKRASRQPAVVSPQDQATIDMMRSKSHSRHPHCKDGDEIASYQGDEQDMGEGFGVEQDEEEDDDDDDDLFKFAPPSQTAQPVSSAAASTIMPAPGGLLPAHQVSPQFHPLQTATTATTTDTSDIQALADTPDEQRNISTAQSRPQTSAARSSWDHANSGATKEVHHPFANLNNMTESQKLAMQYQSSKVSMSSKRSDSPEELNTVQIYPNITTQESSGSQKRRQPYQYPGSPVYTTTPGYMQAGGVNDATRQDTPVIELADRRRQSSSVTASYPPEYGLHPEDGLKTSTKTKHSQKYSKHYVDVGNAHIGAYQPQTPQTVRHRMSKTYSEHDESKASMDRNGGRSWTLTSTPGSKDEFAYGSGEYGFDRMDTGLDSKLGIGIESRDGGLRYPTSGRYATEDGMESTAVGSTPGMDSGKDAFQPFELEDEEDSPYPEVRASVSNIDDPEMPCLTFRAWYIGISFVVACSAINFFAGIRYPAPFITCITLQILSYPYGKALAYILPTNTFKTPRFLVVLGAPTEWSLNPGPFNIKEHTIIVIMSNIALTPSYALGFTMALDKFYKLPKGVTFDWMCCISTYIIGFSFAGLCRRYLVWPASLIWPQNLVVCTLFNTFHAEDDDGSDGSLTRFRYFAYVLAGAVVWYIFPGFLFRALSVFSFMCWIAPRAKVVNQLFGVTTGLGMSVFTFDWIQISYLGSPLIVPWWAAVNVFAGFALLYWVMVPILYYTNTWNFGYMPISSAGNFDRYGQFYNVSRVITPDITLDEEGYRQYSMLFMSTTYATVYGLSFTLATAALVHTAIYNGKDIYLKFRNAHTEMEDVHAKLMRNYPEVPDWWYWTTFIVFTGVGIATIEIYETQLPVWLFLLSILMGAAYVLPGGYIYAVTSQLITVNLIAETVPGYALPGKPIANILFKTFSIQCLNSALFFIQDLKLGHYMKIPPRTTFMVQIVAITIGAAAQVGFKSALETLVPDLCTPDQHSLLTCPLAAIMFEASIIWGAIGPARFLGPGSTYHALLYFMIVGLVLPIPFYLLSRRYPRSWVKYVNIPVLLNGASFIPPATGINYSSWFIVGFIFQFVLRRFRFRWWSKFCFITSAALEGGTVFAAFFVFLALQLPKAGRLQPDWWGNNVYKNTGDWEGVSFMTAPEEGFGPTSWS